MITDIMINRVVNFNSFHPLLVIWAYYMPSKKQRLYTMFVELKTAYQRRNVMTYFSIVG